MRFQPLWPIVGAVLIWRVNHVFCKMKQEILLRHMRIITPNTWLVIVMPEYMPASHHCTSSSLHIFGVITLELWEFAFSASLANSRTHANLPFIVTTFVVKGSKKYCCATWALLIYTWLLSCQSTCCTVHLLLFIWFHHVVLVDWFSWYCLL